MTAVIKGLSAASYRRNGLHDLARDWPESNCYVDLWIEMLASAGMNPVAGLSFTVTQDFEGDQFTFFKFPLADLEELYGTVVQELAIYDDLAGHCEEQIARGRMPLVEVDGFYLPDTKGISHRTEHTKTTIAINSIDSAARSLDYFHNAGFFTLQGDDFDGLFRRLPEQQGVADALFPYVEFVKFSAAPVKGTPLERAHRLMRRHVRSIPDSNPIRAYHRAFKDHAARLAMRPPAFFHKYTFNTLRQLGANHELLSSHLAWLDAVGLAGLDRAIEMTRVISQTAKSMQFQLARSAARKTFVGYDAPFEKMAEAYDLAMADLRFCFGEGSVVKAPKRVLATL
jgi:hypothetical protein